MSTAPCSGIVYIMIRDGMGKYAQVYKHMWQTYGQSWYVRLSFFVSFISRIIKLILLPVAVSQIIASLSRGDINEAKHRVLTYGLFSLCLGLIAPTRKYIALMGENTIYSNTTASYFSKLVQADLNYFNDNLTGYLTTATRQYVDNLLLLVRSIRDKYMNTILSIVFPVCVIFWIDVTLGLTVLGLSFVQAGYLIWASHALNPYRTKAREFYKETSGYMADAIANILAVKATSQEKNKARSVAELMAKEASVFMKRYKIQAKFILFRELITTVFLLVLFWLTVGRMSSGSIEIAGAVLVVTYSLTILTAIYELSDMLDDHDDFIDKIIPAFEILDRKNIIQDPVKPKILKNFTGKLEFKNVSFSYTEKDGSTAVFKDLNLVVPAGQKLGVVGVSGAGKSTLAKLILRFNEVSSGEILLDETDIRALRQSDVRKNIGYVPQEPLLFHTSIKENITLSKPNATPRQLSKAIIAAHADSFISLLPQKLESVVGERGVKLSGGQKQRIAIARAVLQDAQVMVLDEATSALDSESEQIIKNSFTEILKGKTAIVVAHRLSTLSAMDRIIVIEDGAIVEDGTHRSLVNADGVYSRLWVRQQMHQDDAINS